MDNALASVTRPADLKTVLARINPRITLLRSWISHDHSDEPYWSARRTTASRAQSERETLRRFADVLHVERATRRQRLHGTRFANLEAQRAWLEEHAKHMYPTAAEAAGLPQDATLATLREAGLPL